jgi:hypothetical protein
VCLDLTSAQQPTFFAGLTVLTDLRNQINNMPHCYICNAESIDITQHLNSHYSQPQAVHPGAHSDVPSNEVKRLLIQSYFLTYTAQVVPGVFEDEQTFCFQCSREFNTPTALIAHLGDARVHNRSTEYSGRLRSVSFVFDITTFNSRMTSTGSYQDVSGDPYYNSPSSPGSYPRTRRVSFPSYKALLSGF